MSVENEKERKVIKINLDELKLIWSQKGNGSDSSHGTSHIVMKCPYCGYEEEFYFGW